MSGQRDKIRSARRIVVKVGTSTITYDSGRMNLTNLDHLCRAIADLRNQGRQVILVSSGAIAMGMAKLRLARKPATVREKQAVAAVGQCELMNIYSKLFAEYSYVAAQILLTRDDIEDELTRRNAVNTFEALLEKEVIPVVNENDTVSTQEILHNGSFGDNDTLSAIVAELTGADLLILLSDIAGLYDRDPHKHPDARLIPLVTEVTEEIGRMAGGSGSARGTGGMATKIEAARIATLAGIDMVIADGSSADVISSVVEGREVGTMFAAAT
ncbi:MAG: glutamate 5-kinase [Clostridia bacterium]|nr:glutamate 5-kinase [Clostridia bacterium]